MDFERRLLSVMAALAVILVACLASLAFDRWRRRRRSLIHSDAFRSAHVQPTQKAAPTVATLLHYEATDAEVRDGRVVRIPDRSAPRRSANPVREWERQTNHGMY